MTIINSTIEKPRILRNAMSPYLSPGSFCEASLKLKAFAICIAPAISGLSLASFIACYAEGGGSIVGNVTG